MHTGKQPPGQAHADTPLPAGSPRGSLLSLAALCTTIFLWGIPLTPAQAQENPKRPALGHLAAPPAFHPETAETQEKNRNHDHARSSPGDKIPATSPASAKNKSHAHNRETIPHGAAYHAYAFPSGHKKTSPAITALKKEENKWKMNFELRGSPLKEAHGNVNRHDSIGGIIKSNIRF